MSGEPQSFFAGLAPLLRRAGFEASQGTTTGMNVFFARQRKVAVTVNYAPRDDRVSVKLTINRGSKGGATRVYDAVYAQFKGEQQRLDGDVEWDQAAAKTESKVQVKRNISGADNTGHYDWVLRNAAVLREWAKWSESI